MALMPASALAISPVVQDCDRSTTNSLTGHYTVAQLQQALKTMPTTIAEYSNCEQVINAQLRRQLASHPRGPGRKQGSTSSGGLSSIGSGSLLPVALIVVVVLIVTGGGFLYARRRGGGGAPEASPPPGV